MQNENLVSVIMACYNASEYIEKSIESVLHQTYNDWELLIVDDKSTDNSLLVLENFSKKDSRIQIIRNEKNGGSSFARNRGLEKAKGQYLSFLDSDDIWNEDFLEKQIQFLKTRGATIVTASYLRVAPMTTTPYIVPKEITFEQIFRGNPIAPVSTLIKRTSKISRLRFKTELTKAEDLEFWADVLRDGTTCFGNQEILAKYTVRKTSKSRSKIRLIKWQWKIYRKYERFSFFKSFGCLISWGKYGCRKYHNVK